MRNTQDITVWDNNYNNRVAGKFSKDVQRVINLEQGVIIFTRRRLEVQID